MSGAVTNPLVVDPLLTAEENFFAAIRGANPTRTILPAMVSYSAPVEYTHPTDDWYNTEVVLTARPGFRLVGSVPVHYHRDNLDVLTPRATYPYSVDATIEQLYQLVVQDLALIAHDVLFDVDTLPSPDPGSTDVTIMLRAREDSLVYTGAVPVTFTGVVVGIIRRTEDGQMRFLEDGTIRILDSL